LPADAHWQHCGLMSVQEPVDVDPVLDVPVFDVSVFDIPVFDVPVLVDDVPRTGDVLGVCAPAGNVPGPMTSDVTVPVLPVDDDADEPQL
jgi:hypothetical protein